MQEYKITWFSDNEGIKLFQKTNSPIILIDFQKDDLQEVKSLLSAAKSKSGLYILETVYEDDNNALKHIYIGKSDNVWKKVENHITGASQMKDNNYIKSIKRISIIISTDTLGGLGKTEIQWLEKELINEFSSLKNIKIENINKESSKEVGSIIKKSFNFDFDHIKKALYYVGKDYFITSLEDIQVNNKIKNVNYKANINEWIEVFPIIGNRLVKIYNEKFEYNFVSEIIKVYKGTVFKGAIKGSLINDNYLNYYLEKYRIKGFLDGYFDKIKREYKIWVIKDLELKPSILTHFTRAGVSNGWMFWKNKNGILINKYRKNLKTSETHFMKKTKNKS